MYITSTFYKRKIWLVFNLLCCALALQLLDQDHYPELVVPSIPQQDTNHSSRS